jgi:rare lipoprotein A (peptidoglycan hydrolase)
VSSAATPRLALRLRARAVLFCLTAPLVVAATACATAPVHQPQDWASFRQEGEASWYGPDFHGKITASGERYNMLHLTAAHQQLPFNTLVKVTNLSNGKTATVRINDRGPFLKGRILDLSYGAARALGANGPGVIPVRIQVVGMAAKAQPASPKKISPTSLPADP